MAVSLRFPNRAPTSVAKTAAANLVPVRQRTQFTCMASSMSMCLGALGLQDCSEDTVNRVMGAAPMRGAAWEQALATAQHYGVRATLTVPATLSQVKEWTDAGAPVMIGWNPEGREWSHASVIFDVQPCPVHGFMVYVADPNCPDPEQVVRVVPKGEFYAKWYEKFPNYLVRRPALMLEREVTPEGRQVMASMKPVAKRTASVLVDAPLPVSVPVSEVPMSKQAKAPVPVVQKKDNKNVVQGEAPARRNPVVQGLIERGTSGAGKHKNKQDYERGHARNPKHKGRGYDESMALPVEEACGAEYPVPVPVTDGGNPWDGRMSRMGMLRLAGYTNGGASLLPSEAAQLRAAGLEDACWEGYEAVGMKEQDGKQVPNCVPVKKAADTHGFPPRAVDVRWTESGVSGSKNEVANTKRNVPADQLTKLANGSKSAARYRDPYWMTAKFPGVDNKGRPFKRGDRVFYYPNSKVFLTGEDAVAASEDFAQAAAYEEYNNRYASGSHTPYMGLIEADDALFYSVINPVRSVAQMLESVEDIPASSVPFLRQLNKTQDVLRMARGETIKLRQMVERHQYWSPDDSE
jgi:hypothetical protein